jgi:hypothetical protein
LSDVDLALFHFFNGLAGRSWSVDSVVALSLANDLIKSAIIGATFFAAWYSGTTERATFHARRTLLITLMASMLTLATTAVISSRVLQPRPYLQAHKIYRLKADRLEPLPRLAFRQPLDNRARERERAYESGNIPPNDLTSFASDHAGFFVCLSLGIWMAAKRPGIIALAWTLCVILVGKMMTGMHLPREIAVGCLVAVLWLGICSYFSRSIFDRIGDRIVTWTTQHASLTAAVLFIAIFEVASTLDHVKALVAAVGKHL